MSFYIRVAEDEMYPNQVRDFLYKISALDTAQLISYQEKSDKKNTRLSIVAIIEVDDQETELKVEQSLITAYEY